MTSLSDHQITEESDALLSALQRHFGFDQFQPGQRAVIESVLSGDPTLAVMPTGAGKSLCYQLPALMLEGVTLVVSPLISLMKDQVDALRERSIATAYINSTLSSAEQREVISAMERAEYKLVYVAPERFGHQQFLRALQSVKISLIAIDEAHCISRWGHNFRPHYARLGEHLAHLDPTRVMACTATATPRVSADILTTLRFQEPRTHIAGFLRENLYLEARLCPSERSRQEQLEAFLDVMLAQHEQGALIIYSTTVKRVEKYAQVCINKLGADQVAMYHGRLPNRERDSAQERFMNGEVRVVVATNAFGMGVDRSDVRGVVHIDLPGTLEGYYQEVGRAGRDRLPAHCLLLYMNIDARTHEFLINRSNPSPQHMQAVWDVLREYTLASDEPYSVEVLKERFTSSAEPIETPLRHFKSAQIIHIDSWSNTIEVNATYLETLEVTALPLEIDTLSHQRQHELDNLDRILEFARSGLCRHTHLLQYFGEGADGECPQASECDRCTPSPAAYLSPTQATGELSEDERRITLKALSGVARAKGIYGKTRVIEMLSGSRSAKLEQSFLKNLSTYGILAHLGAEGCKDVIGVLIGAGLCRIAPRQLRSGELSNYKSLQITPEGLGVMSGRVPPSFRLERRWVERERAHVTPQEDSREVLKVNVSSQHPRASSTPLSSQPQSRWHAQSVNSSPSKLASRPTSKPIEALPDDPQLREELRRYRLEQARQRSIPPFAVFSDAVLRGLIETRPHDQESFLSIRGLGPAKWAQYGNDILHLIAQHPDH